MSKEREKFRLEKFAETQRAILFGKRNDVTLCAVRKKRVVEKCKADARALAGWICKEVEGPTHSSKQNEHDMSRVCSEGNGEMVCVLGEGFFFG